MGRINQKQIAMKEKIVVTLFITYQQLAEDPDVKETEVEDNEEEEIEDGTTDVNILLEREKQKVKEVHKLR